MVVSFKLETNGNVLAAKAALAMNKYAVDAVVANRLADYRRRVWLVRRLAGVDPQGDRLVREPIPGRGGATASAFASAAMPPPRALIPVVHFPDPSNPAIRGDEAAPIAVSNVVLDEIVAGAASAAASAAGAAGDGLPAGATSMAVAVDAPCPVEVPLVEAITAAHEEHIGEDVGGD